MNIQINKKFFIFVVILTIFSLIGLTIDNWVSQSTPELFIAGVSVAVLFFPAILAILVSFLLGTLVKVIIVLKDFITKKEPIQLKNIFPRTVSLPLVVLFALFFYWSLLCNSLNTAREKPLASAIISILTSERGMAELYYEQNNGSYGGQKPASHETCSAESTMFVDKNSGLRNIESNRAYIKDSMVCAVGGKGQTWAVSVKFRTDLVQNSCIPFSKGIKDFFITPKESLWCVDSSGKAGPSLDVETHNDGSVGCATPPVL
ncbi:MAG: hypothetical protein AAB552_02730 [Patescibacteria group bacterium]